MDKGQFRTDAKRAPAQPELLRGWSASKFEKSEERKPEAQKYEPEGFNL
jgi:hypothetical protein